MWKYIKNWFKKSDKKNSSDLDKASSEAEKPASSSDKKITLEFVSNKNLNILFENIKKRLKNTAEHATTPDQMQLKTTDIEYLKASFLNCKYQLNIDANYNEPIPLILSEDANKVVADAKSSRQNKLLILLVNRWLRGEIDSTSRITFGRQKNGLAENSEGYTSRVIIPLEGFSVFCSKSKRKIIDEKLKPIMVSDQEEQDCEILRSESVHYKSVADAYRAYLELGGGYVSAFRIFGLFGYNSQDVVEKALESRASKRPEGASAYLRYIPFKTGQ